MSNTVPGHAAGRNSGDLEKADSPRYHSRGSSSRKPSSESLRDAHRQYRPASAAASHEDEFLEQVESELLRSDFDHHHGSNRQSPEGKHSTTEETSTFDSDKQQHDDEHLLTSAYTHHDHQHAMRSPGAGTYHDAAVTKRKVRAGIFYVLAGTLYELVVYKLAQRTPRPAATMFVPMDFVILCISGWLAMFLIRRSRSSRLQNLFGVSNNATAAQSLHSTLSSAREVLPLAATAVSAAGLRVLKDSYLSSAISSSITIYVAPALLILLHFLNLHSELPQTGFFTLTAVVVPLLFGLALTDLSALPIGAVTAVCFVLAEACKIAFAKRWLSYKGASPLETLLSYLPSASLLALTTIVPLALLNGSQGVPKLHRWPLYLLAHVITSGFNQISTLVAINAFTSPISVALLAVPRGLLVTCFHGGINQGKGATHEYFATCLVSLFLVILTSTELRGFLCRSPTRDPQENGFLASHQRSPPSRHTTHSEGKDASMAYVSSSTTRMLAYASFLPLLYWFVSQISSPPTRLYQGLNAVQYHTRSYTVDIVISHFDETHEQVRAMIDLLLYYPWIKNRDPRFIIYTKGAFNDSESLDHFKSEVRADAVYHLENRGREAGTYISHILQNYNASLDPSLAQSYSQRGFADHTLFMQPHLAWDWIAKERLWLFKDETGYLHFAPYVKLDCGKDMAGNGDFPRLREIYCIFREELCPPTLQLGAYSSQFVVSKQRILANSYHKYKAIHDIIAAEGDHWIHQEGTWWKYHGEPGPTNPFFGHAMERSWPTIFDCVDPAPADYCAGDNYNSTGCQCFDSL